MGGWSVRLGREASGASWPRSGRVPDGRCGRGTQYMWPFNVSNWSPGHGRLRAVYGLCLRVRLVGHVCVSDWMSGGAGATGACRPVEGRGTCGRTHSETPKSTAALLPHNFKLALCLTQVTPQSLLPTSVPVCRASGVPGTCALSSPLVFSVQLEPEYREWT